MPLTKCQEKNRKRDERRRRKRLHCETGTTEPIHDKAELWKRRMEHNPPRLKGTLREWKTVCDEYGDACIVGRLHGFVTMTSPVLFMTNTLCQTQSGSFYALQDPHSDYLAHRIKYGLGDVTTKPFAFHPSHHSACFFFLSK